MTSAETPVAAWAALRRMQQAIGIFMTTAWVLLVGVLRFGAGKRYGLAASPWRVAIPGVVGDDCRGRRCAVRMKRVPVAFVTVFFSSAIVPAWRAERRWLAGSFLFSGAAFALGWAIILMLHLVLPWTAEPVGCGAMGWEVAHDTLNPGRCDGPLPVISVGLEAWKQLVPASLVVAAGSLVPAAMVRGIRNLSQRALHPAT